MSQFGLSDFLRFRLMIAPVVIQVLFWIGLVALIGAGMRLITTGYTLYGIGTLILGPFVWRITCESSILFYRMHDCLEQLARNTGADPSSRGRGAPEAIGTVYTADQAAHALDYGLLISEISVGEHYQTRDGRVFKVLKFARDGIQVAFEGGKTETFSPIDSNVAEGLWSFDIRRARSW
jgi:hypothetical protein